MDVTAQVPFKWKKWLLGFFVCCFAAGFVFLCLCAALAQRIGLQAYDPLLLELLRADFAFSGIADVKFMYGWAWFADDGHYHIDFEEVAS